MTPIIIIDDDIEFCFILRDFLSAHDIDLKMQHDGDSGLSDLRSNPYRMILLDIMLPDRDGLEILNEIRSFSSLSVLLVSALGSEGARITGLNEGADDYLPKPFNPRELLARIHAVLRRCGTTSGSGRVSKVGNSYPLALNRGAREASYRDMRISLTEVEFNLLNTFMDSPGTVLTREDLMESVFQRKFDPLDRSLDVHISRLRKKLDVVQEFCNPIRSIRNSGYLFSCESNEQSFVE